MPRFNSPRDYRLFKHYSNEMVNDVVQTAVVLWKINTEETAYNLYGESLSKTYYTPVETYCMINREDTTRNYEGFGADVAQNTQFRFNRHTLEELGFYPEIGDIIEITDQYDGLAPGAEYFEISNVREDQWIGGLSFNNFSIICETFMVRKSSLDLEAFIR